MSANKNVCVVGVDVVLCCERWLWWFYFDSKQSFYSSQNLGGVKNKTGKLNFVFVGKKLEKSTRQDAVKSFVAFNENQSIVELFF